MLDTQMTSNPIAANGSMPSAAILEPKTEGSFLLPCSREFKYAFSARALPGFALAALLLMAFDKVGTSFQVVKY